MVCRLLTGSARDEFFAQIHGRVKTWLGTAVAALRAMSGLVMEWVPSGLSTSLSLESGIQRRIWDNVAPLQRVTGLIARIDGSQAGTIELASGLVAFFVPRVAHFQADRSIKG